ncbi:tensin-3-like isoform X15 [Mytilus galloprovincialis]|uniref:tensin-3-like isoform X15 n=1 Tax=Mytilus galloprovincialis TaxID=29158 RepID=UPI003F7CB373
MLKFVSTKPPKGGQSSQGNTDEKPRKKKGSFRWKIFSKRENPQTFEDHDDKSDELDARRVKDSERNMDEYLTNQADYDNYDSSQRKDSSQKAVNGKAAYTRSWSAGSDSSVDSYRGSQARKHVYDPYKGQGHPLRHVTWSPDVTDGSEHGFSFDTNNIMHHDSRQHEKDNILGKDFRQHENIVGNDFRQHENIVGSDSGQHEDYYWDNLEQLNSSQPFKLFHQGTCALDENGPFYQTINKKTPPVSSGQSHPSCSRRLEFYPRDQFIHHVGKPILNRKYEMYPSVTLPHRTKTLTATAAAANSYATVGPRTLKRNYNIPYSVPVSSTKSSQQSIPTNVSHDKPKLPPLNIPIHRNLMRNFSVPYCVSSEPISSPREISVNSKLIFSPSIYSTPKQRKEYGSDNTVKSWDQKPTISTDYDRLLTTEDHFTRTSLEGPSPRISQTFSDPLYKEDKYLDFIQNIRKRYPHQDPNAVQNNTTKPTKRGDDSLQGSSQLNGITSVSDKFEDRKYSWHSNGYQDVTAMSSPHVMTSCVPQINNHDVKHETVNRYQYSTRDQFSGSPGMSQSSTLRNMITRAQDHHGNRDDDQLVLDLVYITERIISMSFPSDGHETTYQYNLNEVMNMLKQKHGDNCMVINVSEQRPDLQKVNTQRVVDYGWPAHLAPPLERLCNICKSMDSWLNSDPSHVAVIHCKGGQDRIAMVIAAFMHYCNICASSDQAMDRFAMKRFYDDKLSGILQPAQERYVQYFAGLLSGKIKINSNPLYLHHLVIHGVPNFDTKGGCRPFIKVYQGMQAIFTSGVYNVTDQMQKVCISISPGIPLRGDIMIKCFHKHNSGGREPIWTTQFHTCAISNMNVLFAKNELDEAKDDPRFPRIGKVEFVFGKSQDSRVLVHDFKSDVTVPVIDEDGLKRSESYENFLRAGGMSVDDMRDMAMSHNATSRISYGHAEGPVDGSLYATVHKRQHEFVDNSTILQNGNTQFQNGSQASSVDSGISASSGLVGNTSTSQYSSHARTSEPVQQQGYSTSNNTMKSSYSSQSTLPKKAATVDEQKELDMILSDLLNDQVFVTSPKSPPKSSHSSSNDTRTFRTYDTERGPDGKLTYRTAEVNYKVPEQQQTSYSYSTRTFNDDSKTYVPPNAFSYTPASPELARRTESSKTTTLPYSVRTDYEHQNGDQFSYSRSDADNSSWLQQQQQKLRERKDSKSEERQQQEKQLVDELRSAQNKYFTKRAQNEADEQAVMQTSFQQNMSPPPTMSNGPTTGNYSYSMKKTHTFSTDKSPEPPVRTYPTVQHHRTNTVERTEKTEIDKTRSLDELEKSLQAASNSIIATKPTWQVQNQQPQQQQTGNQGFQKIEQTQRVTRKYETRTFETHNQQKQDTVSNEEPRSMSPSWDNVSPHVIVDSEIQDSELDDEVLFLMSKYSEEEQHQEIAAPRPKHINVVEEDRFSLRPIGPGMQPLEPEGIQTGTLPRSTTPSFPVSPVSTAEQVIQSVHQKVRRLSLGSVRDLHVTPPFPITPRSPYYTMQASMPSLSPTTPPVFDKDEHYNRIVSRQITRSTSDRTSDPLYASIPEDLARRQKSATHQQNHQQHQQQQQTQQQTEHREYKYQTQHHYNQQPGQQFVTGSQQNVNMIEGMPPQNIPIQHQQGGSNFNTMSSTHGSVSSPQGFNTLGSNQSPQGFNTLGSNQSYRTESHDKYHTMGSTGSQDRFGTMGSQPETSRFTTLGSQQERFGTMGSQQDRFGTAGSQNFSTMSSGHQQQFGTMGSQQNGGTLHVDTRQGNMHSGPSSAGSPHSPETLNQLRQQLHVAHNMSSSSGGALSPGPHSMTGQSSPSVYFGLSRRGSLTSLADNNDAVHATPKFVKNTSKYWYMPNITREEAIQMLKDKSPGTFVVRDSNSFPGAFGLALKVATIPAGVQTKSSGDPAADLVRHFLIEPTPKGVRLRGCSNEPVFGSLASLVYQHSITPLALPCKLVLPEVVLPRFVPHVPVYEDQTMESSMDMSHTSELPSSAAALLAQGAACNVLYINSIDTESLTGPQAVARALKLTSEMGPPPTSTVVHFKVSNQGITLTDNQRKLFFRRHYPVSAVTYCGMDPEGRKWKRDADIAGVQLESRVFGFVARKHSGASDNACHLFAELDPEQPASAIVNFVTKIMIGQSSKK